LAAYRHLLLGGQGGGVALGFDVHVASSGVEFDASGINGAVILVFALDIQGDALRGHGAKLSLGGHIQALTSGKAEAVDVYCKYRCLV